MFVHMHVPLVYYNRLCLIVLAFSHTSDASVAFDLSSFDIALDYMEDDSGNN